MTATARRVEMIGERLRIARRKSGLSLRGLATRMGEVSHVAIWKYERDEMLPSYTALVALARALDVSLDFLAAPMEVSLGAIDTPIHNALADWLIELWTANHHVEPSPKGSTWLTAICEGGTHAELKAAIVHEAWVYGNIRALGKP
jgi:transcriptional regulator with XRE-family HTH domain